jgi:calcineurin-like phosphoesterase family protein
MLFELNKQKVWVTSDSHYNHDGICSATSKWEEETIDKNHAGTRKFDSLQDMNNALVKGINNYVAEDDILISLGDWSFGGSPSIVEFRSQINCRNIYLCLGNHDHHIRRKEVFRKMFTSVSDVLYFKVQENRKTKAVSFFASHYSHRVWDKSHKGTFHIFGHSHGGLDHIDTGTSMDVGVDSAFKRFGEYRPFNILEVVNILKDKPRLIIDHHV